MYEEKNIYYYIKKVIITPLVLVKKSNKKSHDNNKDIYFYRKSERNSFEFTLMYREDIDGIDIDYAMYENILNIVNEELPPLEDGIHCIDLEWAGAQVIS